MGEINLYQVDDDGQVTEVPPDPVDLERHVQELIEENLNELLGITFLESEYSTGEKHGGRIDTLGLDENNSPVIIEYKKTQNQNVINQGLYYFDWLVDHKAEFENLVHNKISLDREVDWSSPRLVCIAPDFTKYDSHAVEQIGQNIELMRFEQYSDGLLLLELINVVESSESTESEREYTTVGEKVEQASEQLLNLFNTLDEFILSLGDDVQKKELKYYFAYKRIQNFVCVYVTPDKGVIRVYLKIDPDGLEEMPEIGRDVSNTGHYGTGDLELTISDEEDLEISKEYIRTSYDGI
jgi:predicted transport protein